MLTTTEVEALTRFINTSWGSVGKDGTFPPFFPGPLPISIERKHFPILKENNYVVCEKTDGVRTALVCLNVGRNICVLVDRKMTMVECKIRVPKKAYEGTIFDAENVKKHDGTHELLVYDCVMAGGEDVKSKDLFDRMEAATGIIKKIMKTKSDPFVIRAKEFFELENTDYIMTTDHGHVSDGLIFTPTDEPVKFGTHNTMFKWKPRDQNTIDFLVKKRHDGSIGLHIQDRGAYVYSDRITQENMKSEWNFPDNTIVECQYQHSAWPTWWKPIGVRTDKTYPNNRRTLYRTLVNIEEDIQFSEFANIQK